MIELSLTPMRSAVPAGQGTLLHVLARASARADVGAEDGLAAARPPQTLSLVLDRSGSMEGAPLAEAIRASLAVVDALGPHDRLAVVTYDGETRVIIPGGPLTDREAARRAISSIESGGMTALHDGWLAGAEQAARTREPGRPARVLLLSDGRANQGATDPAVLAEHCARLAAEGIAATTFGLGPRFNETLMTAMARAGEGRAYYGEGAEDLPDPFKEELALLANLRARRLRLRLAPGPSVEASPLNGLPCAADGALMLPDLAVGSEAWVLLELRIPAITPRSGQFAELDPEDPLVLSASLRFETPDGQPLGEGPARLRMPLRPAAAVAALPDDPSVRARLQEVRAAGLQDRARAAARIQNWDEVTRLLARARTEADGNPWLAEGLAVLETLAGRRDEEGFAKEAMYSAGIYRTRLASMEAFAEDGWNLEDERARPRFLRRKAARGKRM